jgi:hypothetical protein
LSAVGYQVQRFLAAERRVSPIRIVCRDACQHANALPVETHQSRCHNVDRQRIIAPEDHAARFRGAAEGAITLHGHNPVHKSEVSALWPVCDLLVDIVIEEEYPVQVIDDTPDSVIAVPSPSRKKGRLGLDSIVAGCSGSQESPSQRAKDSPQELGNSSLQQIISASAEKPPRGIVCWKLITSVVRFSVAMVRQAVFRSDDADQILQAYRSAGLAMGLELG